MTRELLTHTKRRDFQNCPRFFYHRHEQHLELIAAKTGRRRGRVFGDALQAARDWSELDRQWDEQDELEREKWEREDDAVTWYLGAETAVDAALREIEFAYEQLEEQGAIKDQEDADSFEVERVKLRCVVRHYLGLYGMRPRREVEFHLPLPYPATGGRSRTFDLAGKLDGLEVTGTKLGRVIEDKLVGQIQKAMIDRLPLDAQTSEYVDALLARGWSAEVAYRHTRWPGINPIKEKVLKTITHPAETLEEFEERLALDLTDRQSSYFDQQILRFPQVHLEDFRLGRAAVAEMILDARRRARHQGWMSGFPMNPSRCWEYGGCEFIPLCTKQADAIDRYRIAEDNQELSIGKEDEGATTDYGNA